MLKKYRFVKKHIFEYIHNRIQAGIAPAVIAREVEAKFPAEVAFFKCDPDMLLEFLTWMAEEAYWYVNRHFYEEAKAISRAESSAI